MAASGDIVLEALAGERIRGYKLAVREFPRSGTPKELLEHFGIDARRIAWTVLTALR